jgi:hypothetical protein
VEEQYVEPTTGGRIRALMPVAVYLLGGALLYWLAGIIAQQDEAELAKYHTAEDHRAIVAIGSQKLLEGAWLHLLISLLAGGYIFRKTRAIQVASRWPIPNEPVLFRTRVRTDPRYIKRVVALGYVAIGLFVLSSLFRFYLWYSFREILRSVTN